MNNYKFHSFLGLLPPKKSRSYRLLVSVGLANAAMLSSAQLMDDKTDKDPLPIIDLKTVVVQGEKQERSLKDTISSVSLVNELQLRTTQALTVRDAIKDAPNVLALDGVVPNVRGIQGNGAAGGFYGVSGGANARVSMLIDGVADPFLAVFSGDSGLWDLEQIEVFRGPQSSNNGRNSVAGALYLKTKDPTFFNEGKVRFGYRDSNEFFDTAVMLSGPLINDKLAFRVTGQFIDGQTLTQNEVYEANPAHYDLNEMNSRKARLKMLWTPTEKLRALFTYSTAKEEGDLGRRYYSNETDFIEPYPQDQRVENDSFSLKLDYTFSDSVSMDVLIATKDYLFGYDSYAATEAQEQQFSLLNEGTTLDAKLNFGKTEDPWYGHIGFAYFDRTQDINSLGSYIYDGGDSSDSQAVYGEINYALTEKITLTGGARFQEEEQSRAFHYPRFDLNMDLNIDESVFLPSIALQYDVTDDTRIAVSARKGYNSAGGAVHPIVGVPFYYDEEEVYSYELSVRSSLLNDRMSLRANLFLNDFSGYQASNGLSIANLEEVSTYGLEVEATALVSKQLEFNAGFGLLKTEIKDGGVVTGIEGNELNYAPQTTFTAGVTYFATDALDVNLGLRYTGGYYGDLTNTKATEIDSHTLINLSANYTIGAWLFSAFINNLADEAGILNHFNYGTALYTVEVIEPRTIGASVTYSFL